MEQDQQMISKQALGHGVLAAAVLATIALVTVILPAEFGIDPIGAGKALGLNKIAATDETAESRTNSGPLSALPVQREDRVTIEIGPGKGLEYKLHMMPGSKLEHSWSVEDGVLYFDFHGEPQGDDAGYFESFTISTASEVSGLFYAPFEGSHGWYWKNRGDAPLVITLKIKGTYDILGLKQ